MSDPRLRPDQLAAMRTVLLSSVEARREPRAARRVGFAAVAVGAVAAVVAVVNIVNPAGKPGELAPLAAAMLRDAASATSDPRLEDGQFLKVATSTSYLALATIDGRSDTAIGYLESQLREVYVPADAPDRPIAQTTYVEPTVFFGAGAQEFAAREWRGQSADSVAAPVSAVADATRPVEDQAAMPRDAAALLAYLTEYNYQAGSSDENVFAHVVDLLRAGNVRSDLRAALYRALALMPSVVVTEQRAELDDRTGTAIGLQGTAGDTRQEIIIDPDTGEYIGVRLVTINGFGEIPAGTALEATALSTTVVNSVPR